MIKAIRMALKYGVLLDDIVEFIEHVKIVGADGKMTKKEQGQLMTASSKLIKKIRETNAS